MLFCRTEGEFLSTPSRVWERLFGEIQVFLDLSICI